MENKSQKENLLEMLLDESSNAHKTEETAYKEEEIFKKHEPKRKNIALVFAMMLSTLTGAGIVFSFTSGGTKKPDYEISETKNFDEFKKGRISGDLKSAMNKEEKKTIEPPPVEMASSPVAVKPKPKMSSGGKNRIKDEEILENYALAFDPAGSDSGGTRAARRHFVPGGTASKGGVFIKEKKENNQGGKSLDLHDIKVKVRLEFSIRSTAASTVVAVVIEESGKIPKGAKFYGTASGYVNKRTQIKFNKLISEGEEFSVTGFAISGKDPGIESEVTDIAKENIDASVKQGITQTTANVVAKYAGAGGSVAGDAATSAAHPAAAEIKKQQEANKMTQEYRVPAGTAFFIYLE